MSSLVIRQSFVPMLVFFVIIMVVLAAGLRASRRPAARQREPMRLTDRLVGGRPGWPRLVVHYATTAVGGYLLLMLVVIIYYFFIARVGGDFILSGVTGFALLLGLSTPLFALASWLATRRK